MYEIYDNKWHYRLLRRFYAESKMPKTVCAYYRNVVFIILLFPFMWPAALQEEKEKSDDNLLDLIKLALMGWGVIVMLIITIAGFLMLLVFLSIIMIYVPVDTLLGGTPYPEDPLNSIWSITYFFWGIAVAVLLLIGIYKLIKLASSRVTVYYDNNPKLQSFKSSKLCSPIIYKKRS